MIICKKCTSLRGEDKVPHKCMKHAACTTEKGWAPTQCMEYCQFLTNWSNAEDKEAAKGFNAQIGQKWYSDLSCKFIHS